MNDNISSFHKEALSITESYVHDSHVGYIEHALIHHGFCLSVTVDIKGAFDYITNGAMLHQMRELKCRPKLVDWFSDFFHHRKIMVDYKDVSLTKFAARGSPQGGIFSPYIFNILIDKLHKTLNEIPGIRTQGFADDSVLQCSGTDLRYMYHQMQLALDACDAWALEMGLEFSASKTRVVLFTRKEKYTNPYKLSLSGTELKLSDGFNHLREF